MSERSDIMKGDKVLVLHGQHQGSRGIVDDVHGSTAEIVLHESTVVLPIDLIQNYSSAARKAWRTRPDRAAGRPKNPDLPLKRMISLRLEVEIWDELGKLADAGLIRSREAAVNQWLREKIEEHAKNDDKYK